jgi:hypothetical protein
VAIPPEIGGVPEDERFTLDRANVVYTWLGRAGAGAGGA